MFFLPLYLCFQLALSASSGAKKCDALGLCLIPESGAYINEAGNVTCPWGMHKVSPPERNNAYIVSTAPYGETGKTYYTPGEVLDIHVTVVGEPHMKFLGILMYAVHNDGDLGVEGCPGGCDGKEEVKVGHWEAPNSLFQVSGACDNQAITHTNADVKPYHNVFRWRAPEEAGYGDVIFRVVIKQGSTNMGHFWWPMEQDLMLTEGPVSEISQWVSGTADETCSQICSSQGMDCDRSMPTGSLDHYSAHVGKKLSCQLPLLSSCSRGSITRDDDGYCWFDNIESGLCDSEVQHVNVCDAVEVASGSERLCPCVPQDATGWTPQTTQAPSHSPSVTPTVSPSTSPTLAPSHWYDPRWIEILDSSTTCASRIARPCKRGCTRDYCQEQCAEHNNCNFFSVANNGRCELYRYCSSTRNFNGITVEKRVATTLEPSFAPTVSSTTSIPTTSTPTNGPTVQPTDAPTTAQPSFQPSSSPSTSPTTWNTPRWLEVLDGSTTCANRHRISRPCRKHCSRAFCQEKCEENTSCAFFYLSNNGRCELFDSCSTTNSRNGVTVQKFIPTTLEPTPSPTTPSPSDAPTPEMEETLLFRQTFPFKWESGVLSFNADDASSANYAILDQLEQFRFDGSFHFRLVWPNDEEGVYYEWLQTSNPLTEDAAGYVPIHAPYTARSWGGLEPSQNALMDGSVNHSNWFYAVGAHRLWKGQGYPSYAKTRKDNRYPQTQVELYVVAPVRQ